MTVRKAVDPQQQQKQKQPIEELKERRYNINLTLDEYMNLLAILIYVHTKHYDDIDEIEAKYLLELLTTYRKLITGGGGL